MLRLKSIILALMFVTLAVSACGQASDEPFRLPRVIIPQIDRQARDFGDFSGVTIDFDGNVNFDKVVSNDPSVIGNIIPLFNIELQNDRLILHFSDGRIVAQIGEIRKAVNFDDVMFIIKFTGGNAEPALGNEKTLYVGANEVSCVGVAPQECLLVKQNPEEEWRYFYDQIQGFDYEEGYLYELRVAESVIPNAPADSSSLRLELVEVVNKSPVEVGLTDMTWKLEELAGEAPVPESEVTAIFGADGSLYGSAGCNSYSTSYQVGGDTINIGPVATTRMACPQTEVMAQESAYLAALETAKTFEIVGYRLTLKDGDGKMILSYLAENY